ncbi:MAG: PHP domain-containing protein [Thermoplasmatota archaeon]
MGTGTLINLHAHTRFSDGRFSPEQLVACAAEEGLTHLAITDHFETLKVPSLPAERLPEYHSLLRGLGEKFDLNVLAGVELDTCPGRCDLWSLPFDRVNRLDLVLLEYVSDPLMCGLPLEQVDPLLSRLQVQVVLAHTDIERVFHHLEPEELAVELEKRDLAVEVNTAFPYQRGGKYFFEHAERYFRAFRGRVSISIGTDIHRTLSEVSNLDRAYRFVRRLGLEEDLLL